MKNEWKAIKMLLKQSCCKKKWLVSAAFICLGIVWKIFSLSGRPEVAEDHSPLFFAVAGIMPMEKWRERNGHRRKQRSPCGRL